MSKQAVENEIEPPVGPKIRRVRICNGLTLNGSYPVVGGVVIQFFFSLSSVGGDKYGIRIPKICVRRSEGATSAGLEQ